MPSSSSSLSSSTSEQQETAAPGGVLPRKVPDALDQLRTALLPSSVQNPQVTPEMLLLAHEYRQMTERAQMIQALMLGQTLQSNIDSLTGIALLRELQGANMIGNLRPPQM